MLRQALVRCADGSTVAQDVLNYAVFSLLTTIKPTSAPRTLQLVLRARRIELLQLRRLSIGAIAQRPVQGRVDAVVHLPD